jgi:hypothetical protein
MLAAYRLGGLEVEKIITKDNSTEFELSIQLKESAKPLLHTRVVNAYQKGSLYCVMFRDDVGVKVAKYPIENIWRVVEEV